MEKIWHRECITGRRFILKIQPGEKIAATLLAFAESKDIRFASMVSAVGSVRDVEFKDIQTGSHLPMTEPRLKTHRLEGPMELLGLEGNIALDADKRLGAQFHILAAKASGEVVGGHLVDAEVFATCEMVLAEYLVEGIERYHSATTGVDTLYFEEE
jgi:predicted DNA-binding protein with PD1-like motif